MTTNYKESLVAGTKWRRCRGVFIHNPYSGQPTVSLQEEEIMVVDGGDPVSIGGKHYQVQFEPDATIALRDPNTDALTGGTLTHGEVYAILYSLYRQAADA